MKIRLRRGPRAQADKSTYIADLGEPVYITDERTLVLGDGASTLRQLLTNFAFLPGGGGAVTEADVAVVTVPSFWDAPPLPVGTLVVATNSNPEA